MALLILAYLGGILTILSPCILPVLPFVFVRADRPFRKGGLPLLLGMALTFAGVASIAAIGGGWVVRANQYGRIAALVLLAVFGVMLLSSRLSEWIARPFVRLGNRLSQSSSDGPGSDGPGVAQSFVLGIATGLLWAPCAGPILGLVLTVAAIHGASAHTSLLLLAYALGAATSLALALLAGGRVFARLKRSLGAELWIRRVLGAAVLAGVCATALGADTGILARLSLGSTSPLEQTLVDRLHPRWPALTVDASAASANFTPKNLERLSGATGWINSSPLTPHDLEGKVVLVDFWTYSCINCLRTLPYVNAWYAKYKDAGFVVVGVHSPEFPFERDMANVERAVHNLKIAYPVAVDSDQKIWNAFGNEYWPADYLIDSTGRIRSHHFGEGDYQKTEQEIQKLLKERGEAAPTGYVQVDGKGVEAAADPSALGSPETYVGYERALNFADLAGLRRDVPHTYAAPSRLQLNQWALAGNWTDGAQVAVLNKVPGRIVFAFHARDLHLVLGPSADGSAIRFRVTLDGQAPGEDHGVDVNAQGYGAVTNQRLYQLVRQTDKVRTRIFTIEFLDPGVQAYSFTFG